MRRRQYATRSEYVASKTRSNVSRAASSLEADSAPMVRSFLGHSSARPRPGGVIGVSSSVPRTGGEFYRVLVCEADDGYKPFDIPRDVA